MTKSGAGGGRLPCPDGRPERLCHPLGFRERSIGELELRVVLGGNDGGVCDVVVDEMDDEMDDEVYVRVFVCYDGDAPDPRREAMDCPVRVWLEKPLGNRAVIDVDVDEELPLYVPPGLNNVVQPEYGYHPANRRRR